MFPFVAFDIETTGISPERDKIIEVGAVRFVDAKPTDYFQSFVTIEGRIPESASRVNGITDDMLVGQPEIFDVLANFTDFCQDLILVAHNSSFDTKFISKAGLLHSVPLPSKSILDSLPLSKRAFPDLMNHRLDTLVKKLGIARENAHRACDDAAACGMVFLKCLKAIADAGESITGNKLLTWSGQRLNFPKIEAQPRQLSFL